MTRDAEFLKLIERSPDRGDGWRHVSEKLWVLIEQFRSTNLLEIDEANMRVRLKAELTPKAQDAILQTPYGQAMLAKANAALPPLDAIEAIVNSGEPQSVQALQQAAINKATEIWAATKPVTQDTRPEILAASLHTLKGKPVLKLKCKGQRVYQVGIAVNQRDFKPDAAGNQHEFTGTMTSLNVSYERGQVYQQIEIELTHHALIANGAYKLRSVLKTVGSIEGNRLEQEQAAEARKQLATHPMRGKQPQLPNSEQAADPFQPPKRRFNLR